MEEVDYMFIGIGLFLLISRTIYLNVCKNNTIQKITNKIKTMKFDPDWIDFILQFFLVLLAGMVVVILILRALPAS